MNVFYNYQETSKAKEIYEEILNKEFKNGMPEEVISSAKEKFGERFIDLNKSQQKEIKKLFPQKISEAEPKNIGGDS